MPQHLHIICLNVPYPADYGGVYDLFYKLPALQQAGILIHLHCFDYGRGEQPELLKYCISVNYYTRSTGIKGFNFKLPYIVASRKNEHLLHNLLKDDYPVLMEGIHCTYPLLDKRFSNRRMFVRLHNAEYLYYRHLFRNTYSLFKKIYYLTESSLLKKYERRIAGKATLFWAVSYKDEAVYRQQFNCTQIAYLPLFLPHWRIAAKEGMGSFCLYHGNLEVEENEQAAVWLIKKVFSRVKILLVIGGKNPSEKLRTLAVKKNNIKLIANVTESRMQQLITEAHVHVLPSFNATGIKVKLLNALFNGRHCIVNNAAVEGTNLHVLCHVCNTAAAIQQRVEQLYHQPFTKQEVALRKEVLQQHFDNSKNAKRIADAIT